jgi:hypothetical protein
MGAGEDYMAAIALNKGPGKDNDLNQIYSLLE